MSKIEPDAKLVKMFETGMLKGLKQFEELFLANGKFINGNEISYADLAAATEIEQPRESSFHLSLMQ